LSVSHWFGHHKERRIGLHDDQLGQLRPVPVTRRCRRKQDKPLTESFISTLLIHPLHSQIALTPQSPQLNYPHENCNSWTFPCNRDLSSSPVTGKLSSFRSTFTGCGVLGE
jgi:hypothetical protein